MSSYVSPKEFASSIVDLYEEKKGDYASFSEKAPEIYVMVDFRSSQARVLFCGPSKGEHMGDKIAECIIKAPAQSAETKILCVNMRRMKDDGNNKTIYRRLDMDSRPVLAEEVLSFITKD